MAPNNKKEYVSSTLNEPLQIGETYYVEFYVSLSESSQYGISDIGLLFSTTLPVRNDDSTINRIPQVTNLNFVPLTDKVNWTKISSCFVADSVYNFITIGNFNSGINTVTTFVGTQTSLLHYAYYYLDDVLIKKIPKPIITNKREYCDSAIINVMNYNASNQFLWSNGLTTPFVFIDSSSNYSVTVESDGCEVNSDTVKITVYNSPVFTLGEDKFFNFCFQQNLNLSPLDYNESSSIYRWSTGEGNTAITIGNEGLYSLTVIDTNGCSFFDQIEINDNCDGALYIPNSFTPNNDNLNDFFQVYGENLELINLSIYNRWGEKVFNTSSIDEHWDGGLQVDGLYIWSIQYKIRLSGVAQKKSKVGHVLLIR